MSIRMNLFFGVLIIIGRKHITFLRTAVINIKIAVKKKITVIILLWIRQLGILLKITEQLRTMT